MTRSFPLLSPFGPTFGWSTSCLPRHSVVVKSKLVAYQSSLRTSTLNLSMDLSSLIGKIIKQVSFSHRKFFFASIIFFSAQRNVCKLKTKGCDWVAKLRVCFVKASASFSKRIRHSPRESNLWFLGGKLLLPHPCISEKSVVKSKLVRACYYRC